MSISRPKAIAAAVFTASALSVASASAASAFEPAPHAQHAVASAQTNHTQVKMLSRVDSWPF